MLPEPTVQALLDAAGQRTVKSLSPTLDHQLLLGHCLGKSRAWLIAHGETLVAGDHALAFQALLQRHQQGEPVAYLIGVKAFWNRLFKVTPATLIPRPETELLIETILSRFNNEARLMLDLGTGSGVIAVTIAVERPGWQIVATDIHDETIKVARENGQYRSNLSLLLADWGSAFASNSIDLLVCNPPYIAQGDSHLPQLSQEPRRALVAGDHGYADLERVINDAHRILKDTGSLLLEHGFEQQDRVAELLQHRGFTAERLQDLNGTPRAILAHLTTGRSSNE